MTSAMLRLLKDNSTRLCGWAAAICAALIVFWISRGTPYHQLAIGILASAVSLFVLMSLVEAAWFAANEFYGRVEKPK
jgi:hypothetical protein